MNSALALQLMRFGFLALLWLFVFASIRVIRGDLRTSGQPRIVLCTEGRVSVAGVELTPGHAVFLAANAGTDSVRGVGRVFLAGPGSAII